MASDWVIVAAMFFISCLTAYWLYLGHNNLTLTIVVGALAGLAGWIIPSPIPEPKTVNLQDKL